MTVPPRTDPHVIVGVDRSMAGLAAVRAAVAEAVRRGVPVHATRVGSGTFAEVNDLAEVDKAFREALGGFPTGVEVYREAMMPPVVTALTTRASHPGDLLFLGAGSRSVWRRMWRWIWAPPVVSRCLHNAHCTVVVVQAPEMCDDPRALRHVPRMGTAWIESDKGGHGGPERRQSRT